MCMDNLDLQLILYKRLYFLARTLDEKDFIPRAEELAFILNQSIDNSQISRATKK